MSLSQVSIKGMLDDLMREIDMDTLKFGVDFAQDLNRFFKEKGFLTPKQEASLRKIYTRHIG